MRREVRLRPSLTEQAKDRFPPGGSTSGQPSLEQFERGPLEAVKQLFGRAFDEQPEAAAGTGIRIAQTHGLPVFPPMVFYARLRRDGVVEILVGDRR